MTEIFHEQRERFDYLDDPEASEVALREAIMQIWDSSQSIEELEAQIGEAKKESLKFGIDAEWADRVHHDAIASLALDRMNLDLMNIVRGIKENQQKGDQ